MVNPEFITLHQCRGIAGPFFIWSALLRGSTDASFQGIRDVTNPPPPGTPRQLKASALAGLLGLFAVLCTIFAACAALSDWRDESSQSNWPVVAAVIERTDLVSSRRAPRDGGGTIWKLRCQVGYEWNGQALSATLASRVVYSEAEAAVLQSWAAQHRRGSHVDVRVDPSQPNRGVFASAEISAAAGRMHTDLVLLGFAALAAAGLTMLSKFLRSREALAGSAADAGGASGGGPAFGLLFAAMGLLITGLAIHSAIQSADLVKANAYMGLPAGLMFVFAGLFMSLSHQSKWRSLVATLVVTCFALTLDWVAFGPGERKFTGYMMGVQWLPGELFGRVAFGFFAILLDIFAAAMWVGEFRRLSATTAATIPAVDRSRPSPDRSSAAQPSESS